MAATMPDSGRSGDRVILRKRPGTDAGASGGRSKCMSGRQLARTGRVGASDNPRDMEQAAKSIRVRNAGVEPRPRLCYLPCAFGRTGHVLFAHGAAGAVKRPVVPHASAAKEDETKTKEDRQALGPDVTRGDDVCLQIRCRAGP